MTDGYPAFAVQQVVPLYDRRYADFLMREIDRARSRIWASIFIVNVTRTQDLDGMVGGVIDMLGTKRAMGLDVRVIVGVSEQTYSIQRGNEVALGYLSARQVPARAYRGPRHSTHSKYVIIDDDLCIVGSHNWSHNAFTRNAEDSIALRSREHAHMLARQFLATWVH